METNYSKTVLITGASSGIGFELARCFARESYHIIMVAHHQGKLYEAAQQLQREYLGAQISTIDIDLSKDYAADRLFNEVQQRGIQVEVLVNNAGFGEYGPFYQSDLEKELAMIHLNVISLVHLTKLFLPYMLNRGSGRILQVGSVASFMPAPLQSVYGATKAFILSFSEALQEELKDTPVTVTVLCPPATDTNFFNVAGAQDSKLAQGDLASAQEVAETGYKALMAGDARAVPTFKAKLQVAQSSILPDALLAKAMHKQSEEKKPRTKKAASTSKVGSATTIVSTTEDPAVTTTDIPVAATPIPPSTESAILSTATSKETKTAKAPKATKATIIVDNTTEGANIEITPKKTRAKKTL